MLIKKTFKGLDGDERIWIMNTDEKLIVYIGKAKDFQENKEEVENV